MNILLLGPYSMNTVSKLFRLRKVRQLRLHPNHVAVRCICNGAVDGAFTTTLISVVTLSGPCGVPVEVHINASQTCGNGACL